MSTAKIRLLAVDDSPYMQMAIRAMVDTCDDIDIVGMADDGEQAVEMAAQLAPDVITMDVNMPGMGGLEATRRIMSQAPTPIVMLSSLTEKGAAITFQALELGAVDYVSKSSSAIDVDLATIAEQVVAKVRFWGRRKPEAPTVVADAPPSPPVGTDLLLIVAGAGGPVLVNRLLRGIVSLPLPVLIAQDMPPNFTAPFVEFLARASWQSVREGGHRDALEAGVITVLPGGRCGTVVREAAGGLALELQAGSDSATDIIASAAQAARVPLIIALSGETPPTASAKAALAGMSGALWVQSPDTCVADALPRALLTADANAIALDPVEIAAALGLGAKERAT